MQKNRLEAFSDGVLAIIITIMVLELRAPHTADWRELLQLWPVFASYLMSFVFIGIYWGNHHHLFHTVKHVDGKILWTNLHLLFWLSLIPFATGWMGENLFATNTVVAYSILLEMCGLAFYFLQKCILSSNKQEPKVVEALERSRLKGIFSQIAYIVSIPLAYVHPAISCIIIVGVAAVWIVPDRSIEQALREES